MSALTYTGHSPVCPHCGHVERDAWEINFGHGIDGETTHDCGSCGEPYFIVKECEVTYSVGKVDPRGRSQRLADAGFTPRKTGKTAGGLMREEEDA